MAKLQEEIIVIKVSRLLRDNDNSNGNIIPAETFADLESVIQELALPGALVEVQRVDENQ